MKTSICQLRNTMKLVFDAVNAGEEVTVYSHKKAIAKITRIDQVQKKSHFDEEHGFGMWRDHPDLQDVAKYARKLRKGRHHKETATS